MPDATKNARSVAAVMTAVAVVLVVLEIVTAAAAPHRAVTARAVVLRPRVVMVPAAVRARAARAARVVKETTGEARVVLEIVTAAALRSVSGWRSRRMCR